MVYRNSAWSKLLEVGVGIETILVVSQALVAEDVLLLIRDDGWTVDA